MGTGVKLRAGRIPICMIVYKDYVSRVQATQGEKLFYSEATMRKRSRTPGNGMS